MQSAIRSVVEPLEARVLLSAFVVTSLADDGTAGTLRTEILAADTAGGTNSITFQSGLIGKITLTKGQLVLSSGNITITGPGTTSLTINGNGSSRVFLVDSGVTGNFSGMTVTDGHYAGSAGGGGGIRNNGTVTISNFAFTDNSAVGFGGGGIFNTGTLTVTNSTLSGNSTTGFSGGGGIYNSGTLTETACTMSGNSATKSNGGAIYNDHTFNVNSSTISGNSAEYGGAIDNNGTLTVTSSTVSGNTAEHGGGFYNIDDGILNVTDSTVSGNSATGTSGFGGGIYNRSTKGSLTVTNSTFSTNTAKYGGGISDNEGKVTLTNSTFSGNTTTKVGGGIYIGTGSTTDVTIYNTIVLGNTFSGKASDISGTLDAHLSTGQIASSNNLIGTGGSGGLTTGVRGNLVGEATADLGPLQNNGGSTETMALLLGSPALDAGSNSLALLNGKPLTSDQRGGLYERIINGTVDIGAYEVQPHLVFQVQPSTVVAGKAISPAVVVYIENIKNQIITTDETNVTLTRDAGPGTLGGTVTVAAKNGVATFSNLILTDAATGYTLRAADNEDTVAVSNAFTVVAAAVDHLVFVQNPDNVAAGANIAPTITVKATDVYNNLCGGASIKLAIGSGPTGGALFGTVTATTASTGIATFSAVSLHLTGAYTLTASDGAIVSSKSTTFNVTSAAVAHLAFVQNPDSVVAGANISPAITVKATDTFGNIVANAAIKLAIGSGPTGGALFGTVTANTSSTGIATFSAVSLHLAGAYTLTASDGAIVSPKSTSFNVTAAAVAHLAFVQNPDNVVAGANISPAITVKATDTFGNIVANVPVKLAIGSGPAGGALFGTVTANTASTGIATFSVVSLHTAGAYTLTASDGAIVSPKSTTFTVSAAKAAKLVFTTLPVGAKHTVVFTVKVSVEDTYGNVLLTQSSGTITLALGATHPAGAVLGGTLTESVIDGVATFTNLTVSLAGSYSLAATDSFAITSTSSSTFVVS